MRNAKLAIYRLCRLLGLFWVARWLTRRYLTIFCYHGFALADECAFRPKLFIQPDRFEERLATLRRYGARVLPLEEAVERLYAGTLPSHSVVITIDDGFHSVALHAAPALRRYGFPASVYQTTYYVQHPNPVFRLIVQYMFWKTRKKTVMLQARPGSFEEEIDLKEPAIRARAESAFIRYGEEKCTEAQRQEMAEYLGDLLGVPYAEIVRMRLFHLMNPSELQALADCAIDVQLHTHRHTFPKDDVKLAKREIADNRAALAQWLPGTAKHFCYPSGLWDERQWKWLDEMGVRSSTTCVSGLNSRQTPRHALRRFLDDEQTDALEFEAALCGFSGLLGYVRDSLARAFRTGT